MATKTKGRMCDGKRRHHDKAAALHALWALVRAGAQRSRLNTYPCPHCDGWHIGHLGRRS